DEVFDGMRVVFVAPETDGTGAEFELLEPLDGGAVADYIERRGEGVQHVAFEVDGIESELERLDDAGVRLIDDEPRDGARGKRVAFVHPSETNGVLLELCEK
ncbi:MAG: VOC family protein, partial [Halobacteria archaeon]|nr:VOC family protein [Halobacteria archaeon]